MKNNVFLLFYTGGCSPFTEMRDSARIFRMRNQITFTPPPIRLPGARIPLFVWHNSKFIVISEVFKEKIKFLKSFFSLRTNGQCQIRLHQVVLAFANKCKKYSFYFENSPGVYFSVRKWYSSPPLLKMIFFSPLVTRCFSTPNVAV
jgi:hypothetical protein